MAAVDTTQEEQEVATISVTSTTSPSDDVVAVLTVSLTSGAVFLPTRDEVDEEERHNERTLFHRIFACLFPCWA